MLREAAAKGSARAIDLIAKESAALLLLEVLAHIFGDDDGEYGLLADDGAYDEDYDGEELDGAPAEDADADGAAVDAAARPPGGGGGSGGRSGGNAAFELQFGAADASCGESFGSSSFGSSSKLGSSSTFGSSLKLGSSSAFGSSSKLGSPSTFGSSSAFAATTPLADGKPVVGPPPRLLSHHHAQDAPPSGGTVPREHSGGGGCWYSWDDEFPFCGFSACYGKEPPRSGATSARSFERSASSSERGAF